MSSLVLSRKSVITLRFFVFMAMLCFCAIANAQTQRTIKISGKVSAADDGQPIRQVTITIDKKGVGTSTNASGEFLLFIPLTNLNDTLRISCIGYKTRQLPANSLKDGQHLNLSLEKSATDLKEVTITFYDAHKILAKALSRIPENYINHPHILRGFYRMYSYTDTIPLQLSEAVFDVYNFGYADKRADVFRLIKARNAKNDRDMEFLEVGQKPNSIFADDVINHLFSVGFLNEEGIQHHDFEVQGVVDYQGYRAFQINFKGKKGVEDATYHGKIYIDTKSYAFIGFDYGLNLSAANYLVPGSLIAQALTKKMACDVTVKQDHVEVNYQQVGKSWVLAKVNTENTLAITDSASSFHLKPHIRFNYQVTSVDTVAKESLSGKMGRFESINEHDSSISSSFWNDYNILLSDENAEGIFQKIKKINTESKKTSK
ncbi:carboxypeptidase-like protein [Mucilaginibacter yixingensis]|uniref:Carboxypeptidase-like protein n=3 Tax=Mucilaginibacter yixingensis TaxID=1295612 RepID=A0A2T5JBC2_9SPHI|nr:carboxypeptidase-like protein [Mucilaginibacter yixingensis]